MASDSRRAIRSRVALAASFCAVLSLIFSSISPDVAGLAQAQAACSPRPSVTPEVTLSGEGRVQVVVRGGAPPLQTVAIPSAANARVFLAGQSTPATVPLTLTSNGGGPVTFVLERIAPAQSVTVPLVVTDGCGPANSFVGAGTNAWRAPLSGFVRAAGTGVAISGATIAVDELGQQTTTDQFGAFAFGQAPVGSYTLRVSASGFTSRTVQATVQSGTGGHSDILLDPGPGTLPPDPSSVAPPIDRTAASDLSSLSAFLYSGANPVQTGVTSGAIDVVRTAVLRGKVVTRDGQPLSGAIVTIVDHPELGQTASRADGKYDLVVNGGGQVTVDVTRIAYLPARRTVDVPWQDFMPVPDVALIAVDSQVTRVDAGVGASQIARGSQMSDGSGQRQGTLIFPPGTGASMTLPNGSVQALTNFTVRVTEYTVGPNGPAAMPAGLPPNSGYTYAFELSIDEALAAGAIGVTFDKAIAVYNENFLNFPAGTAVPVGFYDRVKGAWVASESGRVLKILAIANGRAVLDTDGDGAADSQATLDALGIADDELLRVASIYPPGQTVWRARSPTSRPGTATGPKAHRPTRVHRRHRRLTTPPLTQTTTPIALQIHALRCLRSPVRARPRPRNRPDEAGSSARTWYRPDCRLG